MELRELLATEPAREWVLQNLFAIQQQVLAKSKHVRTANFHSIQVRDLRHLYELYDSLFFEGRCDQALAGRPLAFRFSQRMTRAAGTTTRYTSRATGEVSFEISIASSMLFDGFRDGDDHRDVTVCGVECDTRFDALQRVFEHELVHLMEHLCWGTSNCSGARFQTIASRWFLHKSHRHALITRRERAAVSGIVPGTRVRFVFEGREMAGVVNRVTKRATVLVEDPHGLRYSDGKRYVKFYIPIAGLERL